MIGPDDVRKARTVYTVLKPRDANTAERMSDRCHQVVHRLYSDTFFMQHLVFENIIKEHLARTSVVLELAECVLFRIYYAVMLCCICSAQNKIREA